MLAQALAEEQPLAGDDKAAALAAAGAGAAARAVGVHSCAGLS